MKIKHILCEGVKFKIDINYYKEILEDGKIDCDRVFCPKCIACLDCPLSDEEEHKVETTEMQ